MATILDRPYCTVADVQRETRNSNGSLEDVFREKINAASRAVEQICNRDFWFHDHGSQALVPKKHWVIAGEIFLPWPILTLTSVTVNGSVFDAAGYGYEAGDLGGVIEQFDPPKNGPDWQAFAARRQLSLMGTFGYVVTDTQTPPVALPALLRASVAKIAAAWSQENRKERIDFQGHKQTVLETWIDKQTLAHLNRLKFLVV